MNAMWSKTIRKYKLGLLMGLVFALGGCATVDSMSAKVPVDKKAVWALLPIANYTETPQAGLRAEGLAESLLHSEGVAQVEVYPAELVEDSLLEPSRRSARSAALEWAKSRGVRYALTGAVEEWRYKVGVDGEPAVGITLQVVDVATGQVVWSGAAAKSGWSRDGLAAVAQKLMRNLISDAVR